MVGQAELNLIRPSKNRSNTQNNLKIEESSVFNLAKVFRHLLRLAQTGNHLFLGGVLSTVDGFGVSRFPGDLLRICGACNFQNRSAQTVPYSGARLQSSA